MYLYEELDLNALLDDPEIDPDSPEALYAAAQCHRLGKGTPVNEALYEDTLRLAAKAGSEIAQKELAAREAQQAQPARQKQAEPRAMFEIFRLADAGDPAAILEMAQYSREHGSAKDECDYLQRAAGQAAQGAYSAQQGQEIYIRLGELYAEQPLEDPEESCRCYGMASELGSVAAMLTLADYSARGYGCEESAEQARAWKLRAAERGTPEMKYEVALELGTEDHLRARAMLDEVAHTAPDESLRARARVWLELWENGGTLGEATVETAWTMRENGLIAQQLTELYDEASKKDETKTANAAILTEADGNPEALFYKQDGEAAWIGSLRLTAERADWLRKRPLKFSRRNLWADAAQKWGSAEAAEHKSRYQASVTLCEQAEQAYRAQNYGQAVRLFDEAAGQGNIDAAQRLANMYHTGSGVPQSDAEAGRWWNFAVDLGSPAAAYAYALNGLSQEPDEQQRMMRKAAEWDEPNALNWLMQNAAEKATADWAQERLIALAMNGNVLAQAVLAFSGGQYGGINWMERAVAPRKGLLKELKETNLWHYLRFRALLAADYLHKGKTPAEAFAFAQETYAEFLECREQISKPLDVGVSAIMGAYYERGIGIPADPAKAVELYKSADGRYEYCAPAWHALAACYLDGTGVKADLEQAEFWLKKTAVSEKDPLRSRIAGIRKREQAERERARILAENERVQEEQKQAAREQAARDQARRIQEAKAKRNRKLLLLAGCAAVLLAVVLLRIWREQTFYRPTYLEAVGLMEQGAYDEARSTFDSISGYKDSAEKTEQCNELQYDEASALMAAGAYEDAAAMFESLKAIDYRDTSAKFARCARNLFAGTWVGESGGTMILYKDLTCRRISRDGSVYVGTWDIANGSLTVQTNGRYLLGDEFYSVLDNGYLSTSVFMQSDDSSDHYWVDDTFTKEDHSKVFEQSEGNLKASLAGAWVGDSGDRFILREDMTCGYVSDTNSTGIGIWDVTDGSLSVQFSVDPYEIHCELDNGYLTTSALFKSDKPFWGSETFTKDPAETSETDREAFLEALAGTWLGERGDRLILNKNLICVYFDSRGNDSGSGTWDIVDERLIFRPRDSDSSTLGVDTYRGDLDNGTSTSSVVIYGNWFTDETFTKDTFGGTEQDEQTQKSLFAGIWQGDAGSRFILSEDSICSYVNADGNVSIGTWEVTDGQLILDTIFMADCFGDLDNGYFTTSVLIQSDAYYLKDETFTKSYP